ncbi:CotH kinase family protein [Enhygromyxa salina]|nr:CotH kinase family protein [Enhygromyxa salina]
MLMAMVAACGDNVVSNTGGARGTEESADAADEGVDDEAGATDGDGDGDGDDDGDGDGDGDDEGPPPDMRTETDPNEEIPPPDEEGCHAIYAQDLLPTFEVTVDPVVWDLLEHEWNNGQANEDLGVNPKPYHPLTEFKYGDITIHDAQIRLRGNPSYWDPLPDDKMQFQIGFHTNDPDGHFLGIKRLVLEAATYNRHMLRDRLALSIMRDVGIRASCANNARLVVNGEYYGVFTNIEKIDEAYLERAFDDPSGDLWKRGNWRLKTNEDTANDDRLSALKDAATPEELFAVLDIEQALRVYAAEAIIPDSDGLWAGGLNFYMYDDPLIGKFVLLPWDLDNTFEYFNDEPDGDYPANPDPYVWEKPTTHGRPWYDISLQDPMWFAVYVGLIDEILHQGYDPNKLHQRIETWTEQIEDAVFEDPNKPYSNALYMVKVQELHEFVDARYAFVDNWLNCWQGGGIDDGEGYCMIP